MGIASKDLVLYVDQYLLHDMLNQVDAADEIEALDDTTFGDDSRSFEPGLDGGNLSIGGFWSENAGNTGTDDIFSALDDAASFPILTYGPEGEVVGDRVTMMEVLETRYTQTSPTGGLVEVSAEFIANDGVKYGVSLHDGSTAVTADSTGHTAVNNSAASSNGYWAFIHAWDVSGTTPTLDVVIEHSTDNSVWATLDTFAQLTTEGKEKLTGSGTVNQYVRLTWDVEGASASFKFIVAFARL